MKKIQAVLAVCLLALAFASISGAATIDPHPSITVSGEGTTDGLLMQLAQFDPSLGVLTGVVLTLEGKYQSSLEATSGNTWPIAELTWKKFMSRISIEGGPSVMPVSAGTSDNERYIFDSEFDDIRTVTFQTPDLNFKEERTITDLTPFIGNGFIDFYLIADTLDMLSTFNVASLNLKSTFSGKVSALYEYTPAPLSTAAFFLLSGLFGLAGFTKLAKRLSL